jgi:branched-chain amino acid transport system substrate-binding protein
MSVLDRRPSVLALTLFTLVSLLATACGGVASSGGIAAPPRCGLGTGQKATGPAIKLGAIVTKMPGVDFTPITGIARSYFDCVNDNGGINGHPIQYVVETEQTDVPIPFGSRLSQVQDEAAKLINDDKVLAIVGSTSLIDCSFNHRLYEQTGYNVIVAGVPFECFGTPNISAVNMGPTYSSVGAGQYLVRQHVKTLVVAAPTDPGEKDIVAPVGQMAAAAGIPYRGTFLVDVPISDPGAFVTKVVNAAGDGGGVVLNFRSTDGLKVLEAAQELGLAGKVSWSWSTPGNDASVAQSLDASWNGKVGVNAELNLIDSRGPDNMLYQQITKFYAPSIPLGSFGQMGFVAAAIITKTMLGLPPDQLTVAGVNAAIRKIKNFKTDILCRPWYFGDLQYHVPNNYDRTVVPQNHVFVQKEDCFQIAALPGNNLESIRAAETSQGLNNGG